MEIKLVKGLHGDMAGIIVIARDLAEDLCAHPLELLFLEGGVHENIGQKRKSKIGIFFEDPRGGGGEVFRSFGFSAPRRNRSVRRVALCSWWWSLRPADWR